MGQERKPIILWLADQEGWAYDSIVKQVSKLLPQYIHKVWYMMKENEQDIISATNESDVIISMYLRYQEILPCKKKVVIMLTGFRPFER